MRSLSIVMFTTFYPPYSFGGDAIGVQRMARALTARGHDVTVVHDEDSYLVLGGKFDAVEGDWQPVIPVIIEFASLAEAHRWYNSDDYAPLKTLRLAGTEGAAVFIEGCSAPEGGNA